MDYFKELLESIDLINEFEILDTIIKIKQNKIEYYLEILSNGNITQVDDNFLSDHVVRLLKLKNIYKVTEKNVFDFYSILDFVNLISVCTVCGDQINSYGKISCCNKQNCKSKFTELITDNVVTDCYKNDKITFNLLVLTAYACLKHPYKTDIFKPFPENFKSFSDLESKIKYKFENFKLLLQIVSQSKSDYDLLRKINVSDYSFLKFIINSNITNLRSDLLFSKNTNIFVQKNVENILDTDSVISFVVDQDPITNKKFEGIPVNYLFHGSSLSHWFSILRNGIKVYSGTKMQLHGQAYGSGVYLSDTMATSMSYGVDKHCASDLCVYGVFQVLKPKSEYSKRGTIFVVPDDGELVLRNIIVLKSSQTAMNKHSDTLTQINEYFMIKREKEVKTSSVNYNNARAKRIAYDIGKITKVCEKEGWSVNSNDFNKIVIEGKSTLISINYSMDYPSIPPHIWINKTNKKINNPDILKFGGIMNRKLSYKYWETSTEIHKIIKNIIQSVSDDDMINEIIYDEDLSFKECTEVSKSMI